jgi:hypothetical protein
MARMNKKNDNYTKFSIIYLHAIKLTLVKLITTCAPLGDTFLTLKNLG